MTKLYPIIKNELLRYFISPLAYVYLIAFLILNGSFAIYFGDFFDRGQASLAPMFAYHPWLYLLFLTGISMRLWADEFKSKTITQILTQPVSIATFVWGKFIAALIFATSALALTFPFWITTNILGSPDNGVIFISYIGSFLLIACMLSISQTMSALTSNQVIALVLSVIANLIFFLSGLEFILGFFRVFAPLAIVDMIASFSFITHFGTITQGLFELRDLIFFASIIILFNLSTVLIISFKTSGTSKLFKSNSRNYYIIIFIIFMLGFTGLNLLANNYTRNIQIDFTQEKRFTLTDSATKILQNLPQNVTAKLYYSKILEQRDSNVRLLFDQVRTRLDSFQKASNGKFNYIIFNPKPLDEIEDIAYAEGLQPIPLIDNNQNAFFGLSLSNEAGQKRIIPFFPQERAAFLEQDIITKVFSLNHKKKNVGIISTLPVFDTSMSYNYVTPKWEIINQIEEVFNVTQINKKSDFNNIDVLLIIHPQNFTKELLDLIKDYTEKGGKSVILMDVATDAPRLFSSVSYELTASDLGGLEKLFGFHFYPDVTVADLENSITVDVTTDYKSNPLFTQDVLQFILKKNNLNPSAIETKNLNSIFMVSTSMLSQASQDVYFIPLLTASKNSEAMPAAVAQKSIHPSTVLSNFHADDIEKVLAAKLISKDKSHPFEAIVIADSDFIYEKFWAKNVTFLDNTYYIPLFDNAAFLLDSLESLSGDDILIGLQNQTPLSRNFVDLESSRKNSQLVFKQKENEIFTKIDLAKKQLQEIISKKNFEERQNFIPDELAIIAGIRKNLNNFRQELAQIKIKQEQDLKRIELSVKFFNIYLIPILILLTLSLINLRQLRLQAIRFRLNKPFIVIALGSSTLLGLGIASVYLNNYNYSLNYLNQPAFEKLHQGINDISKINLESASGKLSFYKQDGIWMLQGLEDIPVYQERIKALLSTTIDAVIFEKKSNRADLMPDFGFKPFDEQGSKTTHLSFQNTDGKIIESFDVGNYDLDLGRGTKAAYIRFDNLFQVWLIKADFINLSTNWQDWTYSSLWNLRFGRLESYNNITNIDKVADMAKILLNTKIIGAYKPEHRSEKCGNGAHQPNIFLPNEINNSNLHLNVEGDNKTDIKFYTYDSKYYVCYTILAQDSADKLNFFNSYAKNKYYEISPESWKKINEAINQRTN